jgi:rhodanese-related sulfurtransferase
MKYLLSQMENKLCFFLNEIFIIDCREEFREQYKREHPKNKSVAAVSIQLLLV